MSKVISYLYSLRKQFTKYFIIGFSGVFLDLGTLYIFKIQLGIIPTFAVALNQIIIIFYNFTLNKYWTFKSREMSHKQLVRYLILVAVNYGLSVGIMYIFNHRLGFDYLLVRLATIVCMVSYNFFIYKYWVYKENE